MNVITQTGSVSHGTMRPEDLIPAFLSVLNVGPAERAYYQRQFNTAQECDDRDALDELTSTLMDALDAFSPKGHYFGAHPGDGSDYGWWPVEDEEDENG